jgi:hypothetical protein
MIWDINLFGLYVNGGLATGMAAALLTLVLGRLLGVLGAYEWLWHPALADLALFVLLWGGLAAGAYYAGDSLSLMIG